MEQSVNLGNETRKHRLRQRAFDRVWDHFIINGAPFGWNDQINLCSYCGPTGARCAVGILTSENRAKTLERRFSGYSIAEIVKSRINPGAYVPKWFSEVVNFLQNIQSAHDDAASRAGNGYGTPRAYLRDRMIQEAERWRLQVPE